MLRTVSATRYVTPLREGGSLPAIVEADDDGTYVLKFRGAGQGQRALIAELVAGEIGRALGLPVPEIVLVDLNPVLARSEPDPEIQALIEASGGLNLALDYLPGSIGFDPLIAPPPEPDLAAAVVWFDAYVTNVDRTIKNPNLMLWHKNLWLIDHGASLFFHHSWDDYRERSRAPFPRIKDHVLLPTAANIGEIDGRLAGRLTRDTLEAIVADIPDSWLGDEPRFSDIADHRAGYLAYLTGRLATPRAFAEEAEHARRQQL
ncbi:MAG TPA: HipA family kinase [Chloroflexota bacterium]|nr:HipA family kinase [Chloroflexota bacterium]